MGVTARIDRLGRILIPQQLRRQLEFTENSELILDVENRELRIHTREEALRRAREHLKGLKKRGESVTDEFLAERRQEALREIEELDR